MTITGPAAPDRHVEAGRDLAHAGRRVPGLAKRRCAALARADAEAAWHDDPAPGRYRPTRCFRAGHANHGPWTADNDW
ncbi:hypothetical protein ACFXDH_47855 [Streptomyces sp. NPDC059467]|uniref:hypothetical protein n=1 Tax=Streptomyces sp. NPDC059467 TaxID=3346844 RepID=UPI00367C698E